MLKRWPIFVLILTVVAAGVFWKREPLMLAWMAANTDQTSLDERIALIEDGVEIRLPQSGEAPYPVVLQFHGCAGIRPPFQEQWADVANRAGYAAVIVDSTGPRGYSRSEGGDIICNGKALIGQERAGDVFAAINIAENDHRLDTSRLILSGWSHGAWTIMDYLTMDGEKRRPAGMNEKLSAPAAMGAALFYPYCGPGALSRFRDWTQAPKTLAFIANADEIVPAEECISYFARRKESGDTVDFVVYDGAHHVFDDPFLEPEWIHWYNEEYHADAAKRYEAFLTSLN